MTMRAKVSLIAGLSAVMLACSKSPKTAAEMEGDLVLHITSDLSDMKFARRDVPMGSSGTIYLFGRKIGNPGVMMETAEGSLEKFLGDRGFDSVTASEVIEKTGMSDTLLPMAPNNTDRVALYEGPNYFVFALLRTRSSDDETELSIKLEECPLAGYPKHY